MRRISFFRLLLAWLLTGVTAVLAQSGAAALADPTRPPSGVSAPAADGEAQRGRVLQSVLIPRKGKPQAVIDGQLYGLGQLYGEARLVKISEREVVLDGAQGVERLLLTPGVEKVNISNGQAKRDARKASAPGSARSEGKP